MCALFVPSKPMVIISWEYQLYIHEEEKIWFTLDILRLVNPDLTAVSREHGGDGTPDMYHVVSYIITHELQCTG